AGGQGLEGTGVLGRSGIGGLHTREVVRAVVGAARVEREVACLGLATVVVDHVLTHDQRRRLIVVGDRAVLRLAVGDRAGTVGRVREIGSASCRMGGVVRV